MPDGIDPSRLTAVIDALLERWARHCRGRAEQLGYPTESPISRAMREGAGAPQPGRPPELPPDVVKVDRCVARLKPKLKRAIVVQFLASWDWPVPVRAKACRCCPATYYNRLARARRDLAVALDLA